MSRSNSSSTAKSLPTDKFYSNTYHFDPEKMCYCPSGKMFGQCCGTTSSLRAMPSNLHVFNHFISKADCLRMIRYADKQRRSWLEIIDSEKSTEKMRVMRRDPARVTQSVDMGKKQAVIEDWFRRACLEKFGGHSVAEWFEKPQVLRYAPGGKYAIHSDSEHFDFEARRFYRFIDRDFSMLIYLNDEYEGGELNFPWLNYRYRPQAGDLVIFPSNHIFSHESLPITRGIKYALVSWGAFLNSPRVSRPRMAMPLR